MGMEIELGISKVLDPFFLVLDETAQEWFCADPLPDFAQSLHALAGVGFVQRH